MSEFDRYTNHYYLLELGNQLVIYFKISWKYLYARENCRER